MIGKEIGLAAHLPRRVVDIGNRGLPTLSHGKMSEVIGSRSLRGSIRFPRRQGGEYGSGFEVQRQTDDGLRGGDFERSGKAAEIEQGRHILRTMPVGRQHQIFDSQHLPIRVPDSKGNQSRGVGRVGIGHSGPILAFSLLGKGDKAGGLPLTIRGDLFAEPGPHPVGRWFPETAVHVTQLEVKQGRWVIGNIGFTRHGQEHLTKLARVRHHCGQRALIRDFHFSRLDYTPSGDQGVAEPFLCATSGTALAGAPGLLPKVELTPTAPGRGLFDIC